MSAEARQVGVDEIGHILLLIAHQVESERVDPTALARGSGRRP